MANKCRYKMIVKGERDACYAFYSGQYCYSQGIDYENGSDEEYELVFSGECKWSVDYGCRSIQKRSEMYDIEVMCNSCDIDGDSETASYVHYSNGLPVASEIPEELQFKGITNQENLTCTKGTAHPKSKLIQNKFFTTENGNKFQIDDGRIYFNDVFSVPLLNEQIRVSKEDESETFIIMSALFDIDDEESVVIKFQFSTDNPDTYKQEVFTYLDSDYQIYLCSINQSSEGFLSMLVGTPDKINIGVKMIIDSETYYITANTSCITESSVATAVRILEEFLNSIIICKNNEKIRITRLPNHIIHNISNVALSNSAYYEEDYDSDYDYEEDEED